MPITTTPPGATATTSRTETPQTPAANAATNTAQVQTDVTPANPVDVMETTNDAGPVDATKAIVQQLKEHTKQLLDTIASSSTSIFSAEQIQGHQEARLMTRLFARAMVAKSGTGPEYAADLEHHLIVNTDLPLPTGGQRIGAEEGLAFGDAYAKEMGYFSLTIDEGKDGLELQVVTHAGKQKSIAKVPEGTMTGNEWCRFIGQKINMFQTGGISKFAPPHAPFEPDAPHFSVNNAHISSHLTNISYYDKDVAMARLENLGFDMDTFSWIDHASSDTQGFVVADPEGRVFTSFRGTESGTDWVMNLNVRQRDPGWEAAELRNAKVHRGFGKAANAVWPRFQAALERANVTPDTPVLLAGHSLGSAVGQILLLRAETTGVLNSDQMQLYSFGTPRVGNADFAQAMNEAVPRSFRFVQQSDQGKDPVTQIPPKFLGFRHAGNLVTVEDNMVQIGGQAHRPHDLMAGGSVESSDDEASYNQMMSSMASNGPEEELQGVELHRMFGYHRAVADTQLAKED